MSLERTTDRNPNCDRRPGWNPEVCLPAIEGQQETVRDDDTLVRTLVRQYYPELSSFGPESPLVAPIRKHLGIHLQHLRAAYPDFTELHGKRVLDFACGSAKGALNHQHEFDPWMSRLLVELGARPFGIDIAPQVQERFDAVQRDLARLDTLAFLEARGEKFDAYYVRGFPDLNAIAAFRSNGLRWETLRDNHHYYLTRFLKPGGRVIRGFTAKNDAFVARALKGELKESPDDEL